MMNWLPPLVLAGAAALASILGGVIVTSHKWALKSLRYLMAVGAGFMLGAVFLEMIPESIQRNGSAAALVLLGYLIVHMFEHTFASHLHFGEETHHDEVTDPVVGITALIGMLVHTFFDGVAIGAAFGISGTVGLLVFIAVFLHRVPDGFTIASILVTAGYSNTKAIVATAALGLSTVVGVLVLSVVPGMNAYALPVSAGSLLYVAATDLMPEVNRDKGVTMAIMVFAGMGFFLLIQKIVGM